MELYTPEDKYKYYKKLYIQSRHIQSAVIHFLGEKGLIDEWNQYNERHQNSDPIPYKGERKQISDEDIPIIE